MACTREPCARLGCPAPVARPPSPVLARTHTLCQLPAFFTPWPHMSPTPITRYWGGGGPGPNGHPWQHCPTHMSPVLTSDHSPAMVNLRALCSPRTPTVPALHMYIVPFSGQPASARSPTPCRGLSVRMPSIPPSPPIAGPVLPSTSLACRCEYGHNDVCMCTCDCRSTSVSAYACMGQ